MAASMVVLVGSDVRERGRPNPVAFRCCASCPMCPSTPNTEVPASPGYRRGRRAGRLRGRMNHPPRTAAWCTGRFRWFGWRGSLPSRLETLVCPDHRRDRRDDHTARRRVYHQVIDLYRYWGRSPDVIFRRHGISHLRLTNSSSVASRCRRGCPSLASMTTYWLVPPVSRRCASPCRTWAVKP